MSSRCFIFHIPESKTCLSILRFRYDSELHLTVQQLRMLTRVVMLDSWTLSVFDRRGTLDERLKYKKTSRAIFNRPMKKLFEICQTAMIHKYLDAFHLEHQTTRPLWHEAERAVLWVNWIERSSWWVLNETADSRDGHWLLLCERQYCPRASAFQKCDIVCRDRKLIAIIFPIILILTYTEIESQ